MYLNLVLHTNVSLATLIYFEYELISKMERAGNARWRKPVDFLLLLLYRFEDLFQTFFEGIAKRKTDFFQS